MSFPDIANLMWMITTENNLIMAEESQSKKG